jgi:hypothetical protein
MKHSHGFDEIMIVNPSEPGFSTNQGVRLMRFHYGEPPDMGYYAQPPETYGYYAEPPETYGYYAEPAEPYGYYAQPPETYGYYAEPPETYGYYAEPPEPYGYYAQPPETYGNYAQPPEMPGWGEAGMYGEIEPGYGQYEPVGYFAEEYPAMGYGEEYPSQSVGQYEPMGQYGQMPEMVGYGQYEPLAEEYPGMAYYAEPDMSGYVRETEPTFNAGCPLPTNVAGYDEGEDLAGYVRPTTVNPSCGQFISQPGPTPSVPETFRPLW